MSEGEARRATGRALPVVLLGLALVALLPGAAHAWTPGTHIFLSEAVLRALDLLPGDLASLLRAFPYDFMYGSIAADTSVAKKYAAPGRHCHAWAVGYDILDRAREDPLRAFAWGYLTHLAADSVAHNYYVPRQLAVTSSTSGFGHSYWESRIDTHIGDRFPRRAREVILLDHTRADEHLDRILSPTIFSTRTNRRIFRGMVYVTDTESWQRLYRVVSENSRWELPSGAVAEHLARSYDLIIDFLLRGHEGEAQRLDPSGEEALRIAKQVRRAALRRGGEEQVLEEAERFFGLPPTELTYSRALEVPAYAPPARFPSS